MSDDAHKPGGAKRRRRRVKTIPNWPKASAARRASSGDDEQAAVPLTRQRVRHATRRGGIAPPPPKLPAEHAHPHRGEDLELPPKRLLLTGDDGSIVGALPRETLVIVDRGLVKGPTGQVVGVDPRPTEKAFMWLIGRRRGEGLDPARPLQRSALRLVEFLVRASLQDDPKAQALLAKLYEMLVASGVDLGHVPPAPLSRSDIDHVAGRGLDDEDED